MRRSTVSKQKDCTADDYISRLEAVVRAGDLLIEKINDCNADDDFRNAAYLSGLWHRTGTFKETRSRVNLPPLTEYDIHDVTEKEDRSNGK